MDEKETMGLLIQWEYDNDRKNNGAYNPKSFEEYLLDKLVEIRLKRKK